MSDNYLTKILNLIKTTKYKTLMVYRYKLLNSDLKFIETLAMEYHKTIIFATMQEVCFNNEDNILIIE